MTPLRLLISAVVLLLLAAGISSAHGQEGDRNASVSVVRHGWSKEGHLVLGVRIRAGAKEIRFGRIKGTGDFSEEVGFTTGGCLLSSPGWTEPLKALPSLPTKPFFGTGSMVDTLGPGQFVVVGVAFPALPPAPQAEGGAKEAVYKLALHVPGFPPVPFTLPVATPGSLPR